MRLLDWMLGQRQPVNNNVEFVVFDLETTGFNPRRDAIIEIGAIHYIQGQSNHRTFQALIDPQRPVPKKITRITGITDEMVKGQDKPGEALHEFLEFVGGQTLVAYNAGFDMGFLQSHSSRYGLDANLPVIDVLEIARAKWPDSPNHKLQTVARHAGIEVATAHHALDDSLTTLKLYAASTFR